MEYKEDSIIPLKENGETIYLKVIATKDSRCQDCYFYKHKCHCSTLKHIIGNCTKGLRTDNKSVIFVKINNNIMEKKTTIDIYSVIQVHTKCKCFCDIFISFKEAYDRFNQLYKQLKEVNKVKETNLISNSISSQIKVAIIGNTNLYLFKETKEIDINQIMSVPEPVFDEPKVKPFIGSNDCFKESLKHTPFGILTNKENIYLNILDISEYGISIVNDKRKIELISFKEASDIFTYVDGSPFGNIITDNNLTNNNKIK